MSLYQITKLTLFLNISISTIFLLHLYDIVKSVSMKIAVAGTGAGEAQAEEGEGAGGSGCRGGAFCP